MTQHKHEYRIRYVDDLQGSSDGQERDPATEWIFDMFVFNNFYPPRRWPQAIGYWPNASQVAGTGIKDTNAEFQRHQRRDGVEIGIFRSL